MYKLSYQSDEAWVEHVHSKTYEIQNPGQTSVRLTAGLAHGDVNVFEHLALTLPPPYGLLYVLHTPRGEAEEGRYQSPLLTAAEFCEFLHNYRPHLVSDARFDIWVHSPEAGATIVWDRHNKIFAYGPIERYIKILATLDYKADAVTIPTPHQHHYRSENDSMAEALMKAFTWRWSPLRAEDEQ